MPTIKETLAGARRELRRKIAASARLDRQISRKVLGRSAYGNTSRRRKGSKGATPAVDAGVTEAGRQPGSARTGGEAASNAQA